MELIYRIGKYKTIRVLGEGRYATVYEGINKANKSRVAIKVTSKLLMEGTNPYFIESERKVYELLKSCEKYPPNIIEFYDYKKYTQINV